MADTNELSLVIPGVDGGAGVYAPSDMDRMVHEEAKSSARTDFERDRARVLHSSAAPGRAFRMRRPGGGRAPRAPPRR